MSFLKALFGGGASYEKVFAKTVDSVRQRGVAQVDSALVEQAASRLAAMPARVCFVMPEGLCHMENAEVVPNGSGFDVCIDLRMLEQSLLPLVKSVILPRAFCYIVLDVLGDLAGCRAIRNGPAMPIPGNPGDHTVIGLADSVVSCSRLPRLPRQTGRFPEAIWKELYDEERQQLKERGLPFREQAGPLTGILVAGLRGAGGGPALRS